MASRRQGTVDRRRLLLGAGAAGAVAGLGLSAPVWAGTQPAQFHADRPETWRHLFVLDRDPLFMNVGTVGSPPKLVLDTLRDLERQVAEQALSAYHNTFDD